MKTKLREKKVRLFGKSIPLIAVVAVVFMVGIVGAAVIASLVTSDVTVREPTTAAITDDLVAPGDSWDPGDHDNVTLTIDNIANRSYGLIVNATLSYTNATTGNPLTGAEITVGDPDGVNVTDDGTPNDENYNIIAAVDDTAGTEKVGTLTYNVTLNGSAESGGNLNVSFEVERVAPFP